MNNEISQEEINVLLESAISDILKEDNKAVLSEASEADYNQYLFKIGDHFAGKVKNIMGSYKAALDKNRVPSHMRDKLVTILSNTIKELLRFDANKQVQNDL